jgi:hypothetical protein
MHVAGAEPRHGVGAGVGDGDHVVAVGGYALDLEGSPAGVDLGVDRGRGGTIELGPPGRRIEDLLGPGQAGRSQQYGRGKKQQCEADG